MRLNKNRENNIWESLELSSSYWRTVIENKLDFINKKICIKNLPPCLNSDCFVFWPMKECYTKHNKWTVNLCWRPQMDKSIFHLKNALRSVYLPQEVFTLYAVMLYCLYVEPSNYNSLTISHENTINLFILIESSSHWIQGGIWARDTIPKILDPFAAWTNSPFVPR